MKKPHPIGKLVDLGYKTVGEWKNGESNTMLFIHPKIGLPVLWEGLKGIGYSRREERYTWESQINVTHYHKEFVELDRKMRETSRSSAEWYGGRNRVSYVTPIGDCIQSALRNELSNPGNSEHFRRLLYTKLHSPVWYVPLQLEKETIYGENNKAVPSLGLIGCNLLKEHLGVPIHKSNLTIINSNFAPSCNGDASTELAGEDIGLGDLLRLSQLSYTEEEGFLVTGEKSEARRFWHKESNRIMSYTAKSIKVAQKKAKDEHELIVLARGLGAYGWENNSREYDIKGYLSAAVMREDKCFKCYLNYNREGDIEYREEQGGKPLQKFKRKLDIEQAIPAAIMETHIELE